MPKTMIWESDFLSSRMEYKTPEGRLVGSVKAIGGSFECRFHGQVVAFRPDQTSAMQAVSRLYSEDQAGQEIKD